MSDELVAFAGDTPDAPVAWRRVSAQGRILEAGVGTLVTLSGHGDRRLTLVLPGQAVSAREAHLPVRSERQARAAAPFAVEDDLGADPDRLHFALAPARAGGEGRRMVYAVDADLIQAWTLAARDAGFAAPRLLADFMALPNSLAGGRAVVLEDRIVLRQGDWGCAIDRALAEDLLDAVLERLGGASAFETLASSDGLHIGQCVDAQAGENAPLDVLARGAVQSDVVLQAALRTSASASEPITAWRLPVAMAACAVLAIGVVNWVEAGALSREAQEVRREAEARFLAAFPDVSRVTNLRAQIREVARGGEGGTPDFLRLSAMMAAGLDAVPEVEVDTLRFDEQTGVLTATVLFSSYDALARFRQSVEAAGGAVDEGGSRQVGDRRAGEIRVTAT